VSPYRAQRRIGAGALLAAAGLALGIGIVQARQTAPADIAAEIAARIERARDLLREENRFVEALNMLAPLLARVMSVPEAARRIDLSAEIFLLKGMASAGMGDEATARREFRSLYELGFEAARAATRNVFDSRILPLLRQAEREAQGLSNDYALGIISDPPGAGIRINGRSIGVTPALYQAAGPGKVVIEIEKEGYLAVRDEVMVDQNEMRREYALTFIGLTLRVRSTPPGAAVRLDGKETGRETDAEITGLPPGPHRVRLTKPAFRDWEMTTDVVPGESNVAVEARMIASSYVADGVWGGFGNSLLKSPTALARGGGRGKFAVADGSDLKVKILDAEGTILWSADPGTMAELGLQWIGGLIVDVAGNIVFSDPENHCLLKLNTEGKIIGKWGSFGSSEGEFNTPLGMAVDAAGRIFVADSGNHRVKILSSEGGFIAAWDGSGGEAGRFQSPRAVAVAGSEVIVLDAARVRSFSSDGVLRSSWEPRSPEGDPVTEARSLEVDETGCVFLTDPKGSRILKFDAAGTPVCGWGRLGVEAGELGEPWGVAVDETGRVFVAERGNHRIQIFAVGVRTAGGPAEERSRPGT